MNNLKIELTFYKLVSFLKIYINFLEKKISILIYLYII